MSADILSVHVPQRNVQDLGSPGRRWLALVLLGAIPGAGAQSANPPLPVTPLDEITVTATRIDQEVFAVPYTTHVIRHEDFNDVRAVRTLPDALSQTPGVMIQRTSYGQASPFIRGFTGFRTLMLIDGIRLNNAVFRDGPNQYAGTLDMMAVDRLDIVKGPSSVLYGSDAIGGTVNALSLQPRTADERGSSANSAASLIPDSLAGSGAYYRYASAENSQIARGQISLGLTPTIGLLAGVTYKNFDDLRAGSPTGLQAGSGYGETDGDVKLRFRPQKNLEITSAYQRVRQDDVPRTHATSAGKSFAGTALGTDLRRSLDQARDFAYVQATLREPTAGITKVHLSLSWHRQAEDQDRIRSNRRRETAGFVDDQYGLLLNFDNPSRLGTLCYGVEYYRDYVQSHGTDTPAGGTTRILPRGPVADDGRYNLLGLYLQDQFRFSPGLEATAGVRYSRAVATAGIVDPDPTDATVFGPLNKTADALTGSLRLRYDLARSWNLFGGISQGFRAPNLSDYTSFELARSGERETPAPNLTPEKYLSFEVGTKARISGLKTDAYGAFFHTKVDNQITRFPTGRLIQGDREVSKANTGDGYTKGLEVGLISQLGAGFSFLANLTWLRGEVDTFVGNVLRRAPASRMQPVTANLGPRWQSSNGRYWLEASAVMARRQDKLSPGDIDDTQRIPPGGTPGYSVYSARGGWRVNRHLVLSAALENVFNKDYRIHGSGINEPGLNFVTTLHVTF